MCMYNINVRVNECLFEIQKSSCCESTDSGETQVGGEDKAINEKGKGTCYMTKKERICMCLVKLT